jgi:hypothetical protein
VLVQASAAQSRAGVVQTTHACYMQVVVTGQAWATHAGAAPVVVAAAAACAQGIVGAFRPENIGRIVKAMGPKLTSNILNVLGECERRCHCFSCKRLVTSKAHCTCVACTCPSFPHTWPMCGPAGIETTADTAAELGPDTVQRIVDSLGSRK